MKTFVFDAKKTKTKLDRARIPEKPLHRHEKTVHEHESTAEFSVTPVFVGAAWRKAVETTVCVNEKVYCVQSTGQRIRTFTFGVTTMEDPTQTRARRVLKVYLIHSCTGKIQ